MSLRLTPPRSLLVAAGLVVAPVVVACSVGGWLFGEVAVLGIALGVVAGVQSAIGAVGWPVRAAVLGLVAASGAAGLLCAGRPALAAGAVSAAALVQAPLNARAGGVAVFLPALVALCSSIGLAVDAAAFAGWLVVGGLLVTGIAHALRVSVLLPPVPPRMAVRHAVVTAVAAGAAMYTTLTLGVGHGYWMVMTLALVLRPVRGETSVAARDRTLGTLAGVLVGTAIVIVLPLWVSLVVAAGCALLTVAWALAGDVLRQTLFSTPVIVLLGSSGLAAQGVGIALDRVLLTTLGAATAVALAYWLHRVDRMQPAPA